MAATTPLTPLDVWFRDSLRVHPEIAWATRLAIVLNTLLGYSNCYLSDVYCFDSTSGKRLNMRISQLPNIAVDNIMEVSNAIFSLLNKNASLITPGLVVHISNYYREYSSFDNRRQPVARLPERECEFRLSNGKNINLRYTATEVSQRLSYIPIKSVLPTPFELGDAITAGSYLQSVFNKWPAGLAFDKFLIMVLNYLLFRDSLYTYEVQTMPSGGRVILSVAIKSWGNHDAVYEILEAPRVINIIRQALNILITSVPNNYSISLRDNRGIFYGANLFGQGPADPTLSTQPWPHYGSFHGDSSITLESVPFAYKVAHLLNLPPNLVINLQPRWIVLPDLSTSIDYFRSYWSGSNNSWELHLATSINTYLTSNGCYLHKIEVHRREIEADIIAGVQGDPSLEVIFILHEIFMALIDIIPRNYSITFTCRRGVTFDVDGFGLRRHVSERELLPPEINATSSQEMASLLAERRV